MKPVILFSLLGIFAAAQASLHGLVPRSVVDNSTPTLGSIVSRQEPGAPREDGGCQNVTLTHPQWSIYELGFNVYNHSTGGTTGNFRFKSYNFATLEIVDCVAENEDLALLDRGEDGPWHACSTKNMSFRFNLGTFELKVKEYWACVEDESMGYEGEGSGIIEIMHGCMDADSPMGIETTCHLTNLEIEAEVETKPRTGSPRN